MADAWQLWPETADGESLVASLFSVVWPCNPHHLRDVRLSWIVRQVIAARDGYGAAPEWTVAGQDLAARIARCASELELILRQESEAAERAKRDLDRQSGNHR